MVDDLQDDEDAEANVKPKRTTQIIGRPWRKGQSGNPNGRPKYELIKNGRKVTHAELQHYVRRFGKQATDTLVDVMLNSENDMSRVRAATEVLNRGFPMEQVHKVNSVVEHEHQHTVEIKHTFTELLTRVTAAIQEEQQITEQTLAKQMLLEDKEADKEIVAMIQAIKVDSPKAE